MSDYQPKHRANKIVKLCPRVQDVPRHAGDYIPEERSHLRLGAEAFDLRALLQESLTGNPFRGRP